MTNFEMKRADRARWLTEIASVEAGNQPTVEHKELGELAEAPAEHVAQLRNWVEQNEQYLTANNEPLDA